MKKDILNYSSGNRWHQPPIIFLYEPIQFSIDIKLKEEILS
jgi:hypothetical protein